VQPSPHGRPPREVFSGGNVEDLEAVEAGDLHGSHARRQGAAGTSAVSRSRDPHSTEIRLAKPPDGSGTSFGGAGRITRGRMLVRLDRGDYWQCAYLVPKGGYAAVKEDGLDSFRADLAQLLPDGAVLDALQSWDDVRVLSVRVDRLTRWHQPGLLFIGDAAHAMSPIGGVGINLAVQDAAGAAHLLAGPCATAPCRPSAWPRCGGAGCCPPWSRSSCSDRSRCACSAGSWPVTNRSAHHGSCGSSTGTPCCRGYRLGPSESVCCPSTLVRASPAAWERTREVRQRAASACGLILWREGSRLVSGVRARTSPHDRGSWTRRQTSVMNEWR
jgi:hypothetical protein